MWHIAQLYQKKIEMPKTNKTSIVNKTKTNDVQIVPYMIRLTIAALLDDNVNKNIQRASQNKKFFKRTYNFEFTPKISGITKKGNFFGWFFTYKLLSIVLRKFDLIRIGVLK